MRFCMTAAIAVAFATAAIHSPARAEMPATAATTAEADVDLTTAIDLMPLAYRHPLVQQMGMAEDNSQTWLRAMKAVKPEHREALAFLLVNMSEDDLKHLTGPFLLKNIELAYQARQSSAWARAVPQEIFFNDVLPYMNMDETRDDWRGDFFQRFLPLVKDAKSASEAAQILNRKVFPILKVNYHPTKREKPNQSPYESMKIGYASCTGLSMMLSDACRAVGVPARLAGVPEWSDGNGNHTWTEIWDKQWFFVGSHEPGPLNQTWFVGNAAKADESDPLKRVYAVSFEQTGTVFPLAWDEKRTDVWGEDVTGYYTGRQDMTVKLPVNTSVEIRRKGVLVAASADAQNTFTLAAGEAYAVRLLDNGGKPMQSRVVALPKTQGITVDFRG